VCEQDAEGIVAKWAGGPYHVDGATTSWVKIKNPDYSQAVGRHEFFEGRGPSRPTLPARRLHPAALASARRSRARA
jgi:hypothetical protein